MAISKLQKKVELLKLFPNSWNDSHRIKAQYGMHRALGANKRLLVLSVGSLKRIKSSSFELIDPSSVLSELLVYSRACFRTML